MQFHNLVKKIRNSTILKEKLKRICEIEGIKYLVPVIGIKIRWNSIFDSIDCGLKLRKALDIVAHGNKKLNKFELNKSEWNTLQELHSVLKVSLKNFV